MQKQKNKRYDSITYESVTESDSYEAFKERWNSKKQIWMTREQFALSDKFSDEHTDCKRNPDGTHRFGAIGGGHSTIIVFRNNEVETIMEKCHACGTILDLTYGAPVLTEPEEAVAKFEKRYKIYGDITIGLVECARYEQFCKDYADAIASGATVEMNVMGTGLGNIIDVKCSSDNIVYDLTDVDSW
jgi:hypothetical protein